MATLSLSVANDIANAILKHYSRSPALYQLIQDKPLLGFLQSGAKTFPGGNQYVSDPVKGKIMSATAGFLTGYSEDDELLFAQSENILRAEYTWCEVHAGLIITWTELKKDGISITEDGKKSEHADIALDRLTGLMEDRMEDFGESWSTAMNLMLWKDGSQDAKQIDGVDALLTTTPTDDTVGGLAAGTYAWWVNRTGNFAVSPANQTLVEGLRSEFIQLRRYGGRPKKALCGSAAIAGLRQEVQAKGNYTQTGFSGKQDVSMGDIVLDGVIFTYDPTLDDLTKSEYIYVFDPRRIKLRPMEGEENKIMTPERPYNYMVFLKSMTYTGAVSVTQRNAHGVYTVGL
jgi:hypothetical protein